MAIATPTAPAPTPKAKAPSKPATITLLGKQLQRLGGIIELSRLDYGQAPVTLECDGNQVVSSYRGAYCAGATAVVGEGEIKFCVAINGMQFKMMASAFQPDEQVQLSFAAKQATLYMRTTHQNASLRCEHTAEPWGFALDMDNSAFTLHTDRLSFMDELDVASQFAAKSMAEPVLTGIRLKVLFGMDTAPTRISLNTTDKVSVIFISSYLVTGSASFNEAVETDGTVVVQPGDLLIGLRLLQSASVRMTLDDSAAGRGRVVLTECASDGSEITGDDEWSLFYTTSLNGAWPDLQTGLAAFKPTTTCRLEVPAQTIRTVAGAAAALKTGNDLLLLGEQGRTYIRTVESDQGEFVLEIPVLDVAQAFTGRKLYDGDVLNTLARLGETLTFMLPTDNSPRANTQVTCGNRHAFLLGKYG